MEPTFRIAADSDLEPIVAFMREFYAQEGTPLDEAKARRALTGIVRDWSLGEVWLILDGAERIGYLIITLGWSMEYQGRDAFVDELFVKASHRGRGIGSKTMQFLEARCRALGVQALHLEVERANTSAQALYRKFGFEDHDRYLFTKWILGRPPGA